MHSAFLPLLLQLQAVLVTPAHDNLFMHQYWKPRLHCKTLAPGCPTQRYRTRLLSPKLTQGVARNPLHLSFAANTRGEQVPPVPPKAWCRFRPPPARSRPAQPPFFPALARLTTANRRMACNLAKDTHTVAPDFEGQSKVTASWWRELCSWS